MSMDVMEGIRIGMNQIEQDLPSGVTMEGVFIIFMIATALAFVAIMKMADTPRKR